MYRNIRLGVRLAWRDWRSGELGILLAALVVAVASSASIHLLGDRVTRTLTARAAEFIAGDLAVRSHHPLDETWITKSRELGLRHTQALEFSSVLMENEEILLVGVKAVSSGYPLRGDVRTSLGDAASEASASGTPEPGTVWVEARVLGTLGLAVGSEITLGQAKLRIARILTHEPDRRGDLYSLSPRVLMNLEDVAASGIVQPGSHLHHYAMFAGSEDAVRRFKAWLKLRLQPGTRILDVHEDRPEMGTALNRAQRYLGMSTVMVVVIAGVAIALSARRYTERHFDTTAMLRCLGARQRDTWIVYGTVFLCAGMFGALLGALLGYLAQEGLAWLFAQILPHHLLAPGPEGLLLAAATGIWILAGFALPPLLRLGRMAPLRVLRRDLVPYPSSAWAVYGLAFLVLAVLLWRYTGDVGLIVAILGGTALTLLLYLLLARFSLHWVRRWVRSRALCWRLGVHNLLRRPNLAVAQILGFGLAITAMLVSGIVRTELMSEWKRQLPEDAPNYFALNLQEGELARFREFLAQESIAASALYPIVRGRLLQVDGRDVRTLAPRDSQAEAAIDRELSLTWSGELPADNRITAGRWWSSGLPNRVSVEEKLAQQLKITVGSSLRFHVAGSTLDAVVESLRSVRWDSLTPNFFMMFSPGSLADQPRTYLTSFYLAPERNAVLHRMIKTFPAITLLDVNSLLRQFQSILQQVTLAVEFVLAFALVAGFTVLFAAVRTTTEERIREDALLRSMGASRRLLGISQSIEFGVLGAMAGLFAAASAEAIGMLVFSRVMDLEAHFHPAIWLATPALGILVIGAAGRWCVRRVVAASPLQVLRELPF
jgi:putative ABC transport system permease protein